jgi:hypothetical protein
VGIGLNGKKVEGIRVKHLLEREFNGEPMITKCLFLAAAPITGGWINVFCQIVRHGFNGITLLPDKTAQVDLAGNTWFSGAVSNASTIPNVRFNRPSNYTVAMTNLFRTHS